MGDDGALGSGVASKTSPWAASRSVGGEVAKSWEMLAFRMTAQIRERENEGGSMTADPVKTLIVTWGT